MSSQDPSTKKIATMDSPNQPPLINLEQRIFSISNSKFTTLAREIHQWQEKHVPCFGKWCQINQQHQPTKSPINCLESIESDWKPTFLPIQFFKSETIIPQGIPSLDEATPTIFESSGTTQATTSKHWVLKTQLYEQSFTQTFESRFGSPKGLCIIGLLPSYLERSNSSLVYMVDHLVKSSQQPGSGFYLNQYQELWHRILHNEKNEIPTVVFGVTFALLELSRLTPVLNPHSTTDANAVIEGNPRKNMQWIQWIETGGMKGQGKELTRQELHATLTEKLNTPTVNSEYGMTELLSQAYTRKSDGRFVPPPWMKIEICDPMDPRDYLPFGKTGRICVIDLANLYSCSFIATDDLGKLYEDGSFEVLGRLDYSDLRGCNQLV